jgi:hypothetical protein
VEVKKGGKKKGEKHIKDRIPNSQGSIIFLSAEDLNDRWGITKALVVLSLCGNYTIQNTIYIIS